MKQFLLAVITAISVSAYAQIEVTEINYNSDSTYNSGNWLEIHNKGNTAVNLTGWQVTDANPFNIFNFPVNFTLAANAYVVLSDDTVKFKSIFPSVTNVIGELGFGLSNSSDSITIYDNAANIVYNMAYWDSSPWQKTADGMGRTLEFRGSGADPKLPGSWFAGCIGGSPGAAYTPCNDPIVVSELNYNSILQFDPGDWIEFHNTTASPINMSLWELRDREDTNVFVFPAGTTLPANGYLVVVHDSALFKAKFPNVLNYIAEMEFNWSNSGDRIRLFNAQTGRIQYSLVFNDKAPWPLLADGQGYTMELINENGIMNDGDNWKAGCFGGSPGRAYDPNCGVGIWETADAGFEFNLLQNPVTNTLQASVTGMGNTPATLQVYEVSGKKVLEITGIGNGVVQTSVTTLTPGLYIAQLNNGSGTVSRKFIVE